MEMKCSEQRGPISLWEDMLPTREFIGDVIYRFQVSACIFCMECNARFLPDKTSCMTITRIPRPRFGLPEITSCDEKTKFRNSTRISDKIFVEKTKFRNLLVFIRLFVGFAEFVSAHYTHNSLNLYFSSRVYPYIYLYTMCVHTYHT